MGRSVEIVHGARPADWGPARRRRIRTPSSARELRSTRTTEIAVGTPGAPRLARGRPGAAKNTAEQRKIRRLVADKDDVIAGESCHQLLQLEDAPGVAGGEASQVHQHDVGRIEERFERRSPRVLVAVHLVDAKSPVGIRPEIEAREPIAHILRAP